MLRKILIFSFLSLHHGEVTANENRIVFPPNLPFEPHGIFVTGSVQAYILAYPKPNTQNQNIAEIKRPNHNEYQYPQPDSNYQNDRINSERLSTTTQNTNQIENFTSDNPINLYQTSPSPYNMDENINTNRNNNKNENQYIYTSNFDRTENVKGNPTFGDQDQYQSQNINIKHDDVNDQQKEISSTHNIGNYENTYTKRHRPEYIQNNDKIFLPNEKENVELIFPPTLSYDEYESTTRQSLINHKKNRQRTSTESSQYH